MVRFSRNTIDKIKYYVYGFRYPGTKKYFYIGKGKGNRVFSHLHQKIKKGIKDPKFETINSLKNQGGPEIDIIRHNLTENEALLLESSLIDVFGVNQITNKVKGIDSNQFGIMSPKNVEANYKGKEFKLNIFAVCFKINKKWRKNISKDELYESIRGTWYLNIKRAQKAKYAIGTCYGIIRGIYEIKNWEVDNSYTPKRYRFNGVESEDLKKFLGYSMKKYPKHKVMGPLFYFDNTK